MTDLLALVAAPLLPAEDQERLGTMLRQVGDGDGFVGVYSQSARLVVVAAVIAGNVVHWLAFPADNEADARRLAQLAQVMADRMFDKAFTDATEIVQQQRIG